MLGYVGTLGLGLSAWREILCIQQRIRTKQGRADTCLTTDYYYRQQSDVINGQTGDLLSLSKLLYISTELSLWY
jgi:hypothetical protein